MCIIVASDGATNNRGEIGSRMHGRSGRELHLLRPELGVNKSPCLAMAVALTSDEVFVVSRTEAHFVPDAIRNILRSSSDPEVGCVTGQMDYTNAGRGKDR
jgi:hypothetical protein